MYQLLSAVFIFIAVHVVAQELPYPPSKVIKGVEWDTASKVQFGIGSDQWPMTWADDGELYASWGDGHGWNKEKGEAKISLGVTRITGTPPRFSGTDTWGVGPGSSFGKPDALIAFDKKLYMFWVNGDSRYDHDSYPAVSLDSGKTWTLGQFRVFNYAPAGFRVRSICQYGKGYEGAPDDYLYIYFGLNRHPDLYLARVEKENIFKPEAYRWFEYIRQDGTASWTSDFGRKSVVFRDNNAYLWHVSVCFNPGINRYLLAKPHFSEVDDRESVLASISSAGIFDAPTPWGPWTTVFYEKKFIDAHVKFNYIIPTKFLSRDGTSFWLGWSGWPEYDNVNFMKGKLVLYK